MSGTELRSRLRCYPTRRLILHSLSGVLAALLSFAVDCRPISAEPLLPDLFSWAVDGGNESNSYMYHGRFDTTEYANRVLYRFRTGIPNIGDGPLQVSEVTDEETNVQTIYQHVFDSEGEPNIVMVGEFPDPANTFGHLWFMGLAQYNFREVLPGDGVGEIVSSNDKTSMGVVDSEEYDTNLPGAPSSRVYTSANDEILGISIGWLDRYGSGLPGQWVDATGLPDGEYWLEVVIDPYGVLQELDTSNNTTRIKVDLTIPDPQIHPGDYNDDGTVDAADYTVWRDTLGQSVGDDLGTGADGDGSGVIDQPDYEVWRLHFGETAASGSGSIASTTPEPGSVGLAILAALSLAGVRMRQLTVRAFTIAAVQAWSRPIDARIILMHQFPASDSPFHQFPSSGKSPQISQMNADEGDSETHLLSDCHFSNL